MTPELKRACELVFQEHKTSSIPINWNKDIFVGRLSFGLSAMAKEILIKKNIIYAVHPPKKLLTLLNPAVAGASTLEDAEKVLANELILLPSGETPDLSPEDEGVIFSELSAGNSRVILRITGEPSEISGNVFGHKWYASRLFYYFIWPLCAAATGAAIAWAISTYYWIFLSS
jgi:hypothetical protein